MAANGDDNDPDVIAGRQITAGTPKPGTKSPTPTSDDTDPDVVAGRQITAATPPPATTSQPQTAAAAPPDTIAPETRAWLQPAPNTTYGSILPFARDDKTGEVRFFAKDSWLPVLPSSLRDLAIGGLDLVEGPATGGVTPAATNLLLTGAMGGALNPAPTSARVAAAGARDVAAASPIPSGVNIGTSPPAAPVPGTPAPPPPPGTQPSGVGVPLPPATPETATAGKQIASAYYDLAQKNGGGLTAQFTDKLFNDIDANLPPPGIGAASRGPTPYTDFAARVAPYRGQPMSLQDAQALDESLGELIAEQYEPKGLSATGQKFLDIQTKLRQQIANAAPGDVTGGSAGFNAIVDGRQAYAQAMKMADVERMWSRAQGMQNPTSSFKTYVNNYLNSAKSRGLSDDEIDALKDAANRGVVGGILHLFGSRVLPHVAGSVGGPTGAYIGGPVGGLVGFGVGEAAGNVVGAGARSIADVLAANRAEAAAKFLGQRVPQMPPGYNPLLPPPVPRFSGWGRTGFDVMAPTAPTTAEQDYQNWRSPLLPST